jgi:hypothetical protein
MKRLLAAALVALAAAACGGSGSAQPTPRPSGQRGTLLNPIDRTHSVVDQQNQQTNGQEQRYGGEYEQGDNPANNPAP